MHLYFVSTILLESIDYSTGIAHFYVELDSYIFFPPVSLDSIVLSRSRSCVVSSIALILQMDLTIFDAHMEIALIFH